VFQAISFIDSIISFRFMAGKPGSINTPIQPLARFNRLFLKANPRIPAPASPTAIEKLMGLNFRVGTNEIFVN